MAKKEKFAESPITNGSEFLPPVTREELDEVFTQISAHMEEMKRVLNTQALLIGGLTKVLVSKMLIDQQELGAAMQSIHSSMEAVQKPMDQSPTGVN